MFDTPGTLSPKMLSAKRNGKLGGRARAKQMTNEERQRVGVLAGSATMAKYGKSSTATCEAGIQKSILKRDHLSPQKTTEKART